MSLPFFPAVVFSTLPEQLVNGLFLGAVYALIALGYTMVYGVLRLINFAHGEVYMLGAYTALLVSWMLGFAPGHLTGEASALNLMILLLASMAVCACVGVVIERFAYRPMRRSSRISALITAIGVSLLLQNGGALFLPNSPPQSISEQINPYRDRSYTLTLKSPPPELRQEVDRAKTLFEERDSAFQTYLQATGSTAFDLAPEGEVLRRSMQDAERDYRNAAARLDTGGVKIRLQLSRILILFTAIGLMLLLRYLVMNTKVGRAMRAVAHDLDSSALMGIPVNRIVLIAFMIGSSLAGAAAMMTATFMGTTLTTFSGLLPGVKAFVAAVLGGIGNIPGAVLGGLLMGVAETLVVWMNFSEYKDAIAFVVLFAVLLLRPGGILGSSAVEKV